MTFAYVYELFGSRLGNHHVYSVGRPLQQAASGKAEVAFLSEAQGFGFITWFRMDFNGSIWSMGLISFVLFIELSCFFGVFFDPDTILMAIFDESFNASKEASKL